MTLKSQVLTLTFPHLKYTLKCHFRVEFHIRELDSGLQQVITNYSLSQRRIISFCQWNVSHCSLLTLCGEKIRRQQVGSDPKISETISTVSILATQILQAWWIVQTCLVMGAVCLTCWNKNALALVPLISSQYISLFCFVLLCFFFFLHLLLFSHQHSFCSWN